MEIRKCLEAEIAQTGRFYDGIILWMNEHINYPCWIYHVYPNEQSVRRMVEKGAQYICLDGKTFIGAFALSAEPQGNYQKGQWSQKLDDGDYMVIHALAIDPSIQRQGGGSEVISFCVDKAKAEGYKALRVDIVPTNVPARKLFENNGFTYVGDVDLELNIGNVGAFSLYEYNLYPYFLKDGLDSR